MNDTMNVVNETNNERIESILCRFLALSTKEQDAVLAEATAILSVN